MKFSVAVASLALAASVSAQSVGPVDPAKLPAGWCMLYKDACAEGAVVNECGANSTFTTECASTFSMDKVCTSFTVSCLCTPKAGGEQKDVSAIAFNETFGLMPSGMCANLLFNKNPSGPGIVSGDYKPDGKRPAANATATTTTGTPKTTTTTGSSTSPSGTNSGASAIQMALPTVALAVISMGLAMIPL
ncbi:hypothetical protein BGZ95_001277 [Linnemannia exigua]|uniref:Extracellular membrane protein CFEM domain-containing protein n=1 Tax=Linnemannia exigua TaxID=604196 RepID=A0AAD4H3S1_9FUNG|nr:hypothetical protein BGZ95_001277 [Linnemannia exigua]